MKYARYRSKSVSLRRKYKRIADRKKRLPLIILIIIPLFFLLLTIPAVHYWYFATNIALQEQIRIEYRVINSPEDIEPITSDQVKPIVYQNMLNFNNIPAENKKKLFIDMLLPSILIIKYQEAQKKSLVAHITSKIYPTRTDKLYIDQLLINYRTSNTANLQERLITHPSSIVLAQAALESGWGTSRFYLDANNLFGVWSFKTDEPRIYAVTRKNGKKIYLKRYDSALDSLLDYFRILASLKVFEEFRNARAETDNPYEIVKFLYMYSEQRGEYIQKINKMIESNDLTQFDQYQIDPNYLYFEGAR